MSKTARRRVTPPADLMHASASPSEPHFRALTAFASLPAHHVSFLVADRDSDPHLKPGEFAVVDLGDVNLVHGELYVRQMRGGPRTRHIVQVTSSKEYITPKGPKQSVWWARSLVGWRREGTTSEGVPIFSGLSDGPFQADGMCRQLVGRVVGYSRSSLGDLLPAEAGYRDEAGGNAAFDPVEFVDVLLRTGHRPFVVVRRGRSHGFGYRMPGRPNSDEERRDFHRVLELLHEASSGEERVADECLRRGLVE